MKTRRNIGRDGVLMLAIDNGYVLVLFPFPIRTRFNVNVLSFSFSTLKRLLSARIILEMVMPGVTSLTIMLVPELTDGARTVSLVSPITINVPVFRFHFGTKTIISSRNVSLVLPVIKETMERIARSFIIISIPPRHIPT